MKIMFIPVSYPDKSNPVKHIYVYEQAKCLAGMGHEICVLHIQQQPTKNLLKPMDMQIKHNDDGFAVRYAKVMKTFCETRFPGMHRQKFVNVAKELFQHAVEREGYPDVIYSHFSCWAGHAAVQIGKEYGVPVVNIEHYSKFINNKADKDMVKGLVYTVNQSAANIAVSQKLKEALVRLTGTEKEINIVPNMIDNCFVFHKREEHEDFVFSAVANLNKGKRFGLLIEAFCEAFSAEDKVKLLIGGSGDEKDNLLDLIAQNQREHQIQLLGRLDRDQTLALYQQSDCFALPSAFETFGIVWREAMAVGRPVITTDHGGWSKEEWSDDFGIMIPVDDKQALIDALKAMRENYSAYNLEKISQFALENYSAEVIGERIQTILEEAIATKKS